MENVGWIGSGVMGKPMCQHILKAGYPVNVYELVKEKLKDLIVQGAVGCASPQEVASKSDIIFSMVGFPHEVEKLYLGEGGIVQGAKPGSILVDMSTSEPSLARLIYAEARKKNLRFLDAPVSGSDIGAREGTLAIMVGGDQEFFEKTKPFFDILGKTISYMGEAGSGLHTKMCNQTAAAGTMIGVIESLQYAHKAGLDPNSVIDVISKGAAGSWLLSNFGRRMVNGDFDPGFMIRHYVKDMGIALKEARNLNLCLPGLALVHQFYVSAMALGMENLGIQGLYKVFARINGIPE